MTATQVGIIYSIEQRLRREVIIPDDDAQLDRLNVVSGTKLIFQSLEDYASRGPDAAVFDDAGGEPLSDRCAVIDAAAEVVGHLNADPGIDALADVTLVRSDISVEGDKYVVEDAKFERSYVVVDSKGIVTDIVVADPAHPPEFEDKGGAVLFNVALEVGDKAPEELFKPDGGADPAPIDPGPVTP